MSAAKGVKRADEPRPEPANKKAASIDDLWVTDDEPVKSKTKPAPRETPKTEDSIESEPAIASEPLEAPVKRRSSARKKSIIFVCAALVCGGAALAVVDGVSASSSSDDDSKDDVTAEKDDPPQAAASEPEAEKESAEASAPPEILYKRAVTTLVELRKSPSRRILRLATMALARGRRCRRPRRAAHSAQGRGELAQPHCFGLRTGPLE